MVALVGGAMDGSVSVGFRFYSTCWPSRANFSKFLLVQLHTIYIHMYTVY
jgi:hypothetical protein